MERLESSSIHIGGDSIVISACSLSHDHSGRRTVRSDAHFRFEGKLQRIVCGSKCVQCNRAFIMTRLTFGDQPKPLIAMAGELMRLYFT